MRDVSLAVELHCKETLTRTFCSAANRTFNKLLAMRFKKREVWAIF